MSPNFIVLLTIVIAAAAELPEVAAIKTPPTADELLPAMRKALGSTIAEIEIVKMSQFAMPKGEFEFSLKDLNSPAASGIPTRWRGYLRQSDGHSYSIWAMVLIKAECTRVVATEQLMPGRPILGSQIREEKYIGSPFAKNAMATVADILGRVPRRTFRAGTTLTVDATTEPVLVANGTDVVAEFRSGRLRVTAQVVALGSGRMGQRISVRNPLSKKTFVARVDSPGHVVVEVAR